MCNNTKLKIARALRELMSQRPLAKITVQDLMEGAQMKRQSFYYHFQDIYDVLFWICDRQLGDPLREDPDSDNLLIAWKELPTTEDPHKVESEMLKDFFDTHGKLPFANLTR